MRRLNKSFSLKENKTNLIKFGSFVLLFIAIYWLYKFVFTISETKCTTSYEDICAAPVEAQLQKVIGKNLLFLETENLSQQFLHSSNIYKSVNFQKELPGKLLVRIELIQKVVQLFASSESGYITVLENYIPYEQLQSPDENLKLITLETAHIVEIGKPIDSQMLKGSIDLINRLENEFISYKNFRLASDSAKVELSSGQLVLFNPKENVDKQIVSLLMLKQGLVEENVFEIDLRFDKPILRYRQ